MITLPPHSRMTVPSRLLFSIHRPMVYVNAANTDIRKTFALYVQPAPTIEDLMAIVKFIGTDADTICYNHPDVVSAAHRLVPAEDDTVKLTVHVSPFPEDGEPMEWTAQLVSPQGRRTFEIIQRTPYGGVTTRPATR